MKPVVTTHQMRAIDAETIASIGLPGSLLMENAGRALAKGALEMLAKLPSRRIGVLCGGGNNGGDGFVAARVLQELGGQVALYLCVPGSLVAGDAKLHAEAFTRCGGTVLSLADASELRAHAETIAVMDLLIDALLGTGLERDVTGHLAQVIALINRSSALVLAADLPSGLRADDGATLGVSVCADRTVAMGCAKVGNVGAPGFASNGLLRVAEIGIPEALARRSAKIGVIEMADFATALPQQGANSHKGMRGHLLVVAGSPSKRGAGRLSAMAALRGGAGLVSLAAASIDQGADDPIMSAAVADGSDLDALLLGKAALVMGPGMATDAAGKALVQHALASCRLPMLLDADALNQLGNELGRCADVDAPLIITPHPGEAARLLAISSSVVQKDRIAAVRKLAEETRAIVVLKGARTCICDGREGAGFVWINPTGGPELSTAGTGDVLSGLIGAQLAQGVDALLAALCGVYWHGEAGRLACAGLGGFGMVASDLLGAIPQARQLLDA